MLSAQCTDARVNEVTPALFALAPDARGRWRGSRSRAIERRIRSCGLAPHEGAQPHGALARCSCERYGGRVPDELEALESLPGVGHKTASVVLVQAFGQPAFPVDTHIHRLAARWGLSSGRSVVADGARPEAALSRRRRWGRVHLQLIYFGREHCPARGHDPAACPICSWAAPKRRIAAEKRRRRR